MQEDYASNTSPTIAHLKSPAQRQEHQPKDEREDFSLTQTHSPYWWTIVAASPSLTTSMTSLTNQRKLRQKLKDTMDFQPNPLKQGQFDGHLEMTKERYISSSYLTHIMSQKLRQDYSFHNIGHRQLTMVDKPTASLTMMLQFSNGKMGAVRKQSQYHNTPTMSP